MKTNPFKFGSVVDGSFFTDREEELEKISSYINGENHLILISPRRFGKTSLIRKVVNEADRKYLFLDVQIVLSAEDFASQLLKRIYRIYAVEKLKSFIKSFRIIPTVNINPVTGEPEISFSPGLRDLRPLEDVLNLIEKLGASGKKKIIVVLDEFQDIFRIDKGLDRFLRSVIQNHKHVNYIFMGSSESMIREIFEKRSSPFYRFGILMTLGKIERGKFILFLEDKLYDITDKNKELAQEILEIAESHPFYTQQLAFTVWEQLNRSGFSSGIVKSASDEIVQSHDNDFERLWNSFNRTDMTVLNGMSSSDLSPLSDEFSRLYGTGAASTVYSTLQRLTAKGILLREGSVYRIDDPFFKRWIVMRRGQ